MLASFDQRLLRGFGLHRKSGRSTVREKRTIRLIVALTIVGAMFGAALAPNGVFAARLSASTDVTLMAGPGADYGVLTTIPAGSSLSVDGDATDGFVPVTYNGISGWAPAGVIDNGGGSADGANANNGNGGGKGNGGGGKGKSGDAGSTDGATNASSTSSGDAPSGDTSGAAPSGDGSGASAPAPSPGYDGSLAPPSNSQYSQNQIIGIITDAANNYGQNPDDMVRVARCESGLNPNAVGGGQYYGLYQFVPSTFANTPYGGQSIFDPTANANAAAWMWSQGNKSAWTCQ